MPGPRDVLVHACSYLLREHENYMRQARGISEDSLARSV